MSFYAYITIGTLAGVALGILVDVLIAKLANRKAP